MNGYEDFLRNLGPVRPDGVDKETWRQWVRQFPPPPGEYLMGAVVATVRIVCTNKGAHDAVVLAEMDFDADARRQCRAPITYVDTPDRNAPPGEASRESYRFRCPRCHLDERRKLDTVFGWAAVAHANGDKSLDLSQPPTL